MQSEIHVISTVKFAFDDAIASHLAKRSHRVVIARGRLYGRFKVAYTRNDSTDVRIAHLLRCPRLNACTQFALRSLDEVANRRRRSETACPRR